MLMCSMCLLIICIQRYHTQISMTMYLSSSEGIVTYSTWFKKYPNNVPDQWKQPLLALVIKETHNYPIPSPDPWHCCWPGEMEPIKTFFVIYFILFCQASEKKEHKFKFATHIPSKMEQVISSIHVLLKSNFTFVLPDFSNRAVIFCQYFHKFLHANKSFIMISGR